MSLANLLPPLSKSWADEVNDEFDEIFLDQSSYNHVLHTPGRLAYDSDDEDNTMIPPDFIEYEALESSEQEYVLSPYNSTSNAAMVSNIEGASVVTFPDEVLSPDTDRVTRYMTMQVRRTLPYFIPGSEADKFFNIELDNKAQHEKKPRDEEDYKTTVSTQDGLETIEVSTDDLSEDIDECNSEIGSIQTTPGLECFFFSEHGSHYSSQSELDEDELQIDHPLMGKDVVGIQESYVAVKASDLDAHPPRIFYRSCEQQTWVWVPSSLRCCQTVIRDEGYRHHE